MSKQVRGFSESKRSVSFDNGTQFLTPDDVTSGSATQWTAAGATRLRGGAFPAEVDTSGGFRRALAELEIREQETIHLDVTAMPRPARSPLRSGGGRRKGGSSADQIVLKPRPPVEDGVQVVMYQDEAGGITWHFPDGFFEARRPAAGDGGKSRSTLRSGARVGAAVFTIPARTREARDAVNAVPDQVTRRTLRGPITKFGRKVLKVLVIPIASRLLKRPLASIVGAIERRHRPQRVRSVTPDNYKQGDVPAFDDWAALGKGRTLLVIHGTFSTTDGMLSLMPESAVEELAKHYQGRVIAFDHPSVSVSPGKNAKDLLDEIAEQLPGANLEVDILCHSRGGLVARELAERARDLVPGTRVVVKRVFFVATPNAGTALADPEHVVEMLDVFTNLLTHFPDGPVMYSIEVILAIIKLLAYTAERSLPGLSAMAPDGAYLRDTLNTGSKSPAAIGGPEYAAAAADYQASVARDAGFFTGPFCADLIDRVFASKGKAVANDLVVPRDGVFWKNGNARFPIKQVLRFGPKDGVWHSGFFARPETIEAINHHFGIGDIVLIKIPVSLRGNGGPRRLKHGPGIGPMAKDMKVPRLTGFSDRRGGLRGINPFTKMETLVRLRGTRAKKTAKKTLKASRDWTGYAGGPAGAREPLKLHQETVRYISPAKRLPPEDIERDPRIDFHEAVEAGKTDDLVVRLNEVKGPDAKALAERLAIHLDEGMEQVQLDVRLSAPGFSIQGQGSAMMIIRRDRDPKTEQVVFKVTAAEPADNKPVKRELRADFWLGNTCLGSVSHFTMVHPKGFKGAWTGDGSSRSRPMKMPTERRVECDLVIQVRSADGEGAAPFTIELSSTIPGREVRGLRCGAFKGPAEGLARYIDTTYSKQFEKYPNEAAYPKSKDYNVAVARWESAFADVLVSLGKNLWTLLPDQFRTQYLRLRGETRSIAIYSDEMIFPWELVIPFTKAKGKAVEYPSFGEAHVLGRWVPGLGIKPSPQNLRVRGFAILNPTYDGTAEADLSWAQKEVESLKALFPNLTVIKPSDLASVRKRLLNRRDVQLVHYSGHGVYGEENPDLSELLLSNDESLTAMDLTGSRLSLEAQPILYLNACSVGKAGYSVGRMGGFAATALRGDAAAEAGGCSGVIAPYWPIPDDTAMRFSIALYSKLRDHRSIGEALRELREEHAKDPTFRAFAYFGDPWARVQF